jgi:glycosyltransferase involved in cell wall biosynthesis
VSVILSTYNQPRLLDLTLFGYSRQSALDFEVVVADDGSGSETRAVIERHSRELPVRLEHVWQPDEGFRKAQAVNRAVLRSRAPYLIFSDGDCIPSRTFVEEHLRARRPSTYVVGGHVRLSEEVTGRLTPQDVLSGRVEKMSSWVDRAGLWWTHLKSLVYIATNKRRKPKFYGLNFSLDREVFYRVNGYDLSYENLAREDSDLRNRLQLAGVRARSLWHRARVFHQHHPPNVARLLWREGVAYYNRPDLRPEAPRGLRELEREADAFGGR